MEKKEYYSIGEVSRICNVSRKAMRFYDEIGLIRPDKIGGNNYRFYSREALLNLTIIKYYKQMGFKLEKIRDLISSGEYQVIEHGFLEKIEELNEEALNLEAQRRSVHDWYDLLLEAQTVIMNDAQDVSVKYIEPAQYGFMDQPFNPDIKESIINLDWTDYLNKVNNEITGPVIIEYPSVEERMNATCENMRIMQQMIRPAHPEQLTSMGGCMMISCYHIGSHETMNETYQKMVEWAEEHGYNLSGKVIERYIVDYWTTKNETMFVTEICMHATR